MSFKTIVIAVISALVAIILFKNTEPSSFWLFGDIVTSKLILLGIFYILGVISGGILFRRKSKHPKEYNVTNETISNKEEKVPTDNTISNLSDVDREYLSKY